MAGFNLFKGYIFSRGFFLEGLFTGFPSTGLDYSLWGLKTQFIPSHKGEETRGEFHPKRLTTLF